MKKIIIIITAILLVISLEKSSAQTYTISCTGTSNSGSSSSALNYNSSALGQYSFAAGYNCTATNKGCFALGYNTNAYGMKSYAIGESCYTGSQGYAFGLKAEARGDQSFAFGSAVKVTAPNSIIIGSVSETNAMLINDIANSFMVGFNSTTPTLFAGGTPAPVGTGRVGIGTKYPTAKLHIVSDPNEDAEIYLQPSQYNTGKNAYLYMGNIATGLIATKADGLTIFSEKYILLSGSKVGIGTLIPQASLHVAGDIIFSNYARPGGIILGVDERGALTAANPSAFGDNLGNHTAAEDLKMARFSVINANDIESETTHNHITYTGLIVGDSKDKDWGKLEIFGSSSPDAAKIEVGIGNADKGGITLATRTPGAAVGFLCDNVWAMTVKPTYVSIGDVYHEAEEPVDLKVYGKVYCREVEVTLRQWYDNVFEKNYQLMPLNELDNYITTNKHLPEIPTSDEVLSNGVNVGEMNALLLKKVEELTLYVIELKKENELMKQRLDNSGL